MSGITLFSLPQVVHVVLPSNPAGEVMITSFYHTRADFKIFWNIDNSIDFFIRDFDRKLVAIDSPTETYVVVISNPKSGAVLLETELEVKDSYMGHLALNISAVTALTLPIGHLRYSIVRQKAGKTTLLYTDRDHGPQSTLEVKYGPIPAAATAQTVLRSDFTTIDGGLRAGTFEGPLTVADGSSMRTFAAFTAGFTGSIIIEASLSDSPPSSSSDWFVADTETFTNETGSRIINVEGNYTWLRMHLISTSGTVERIIVR